MQASVKIMDIDVDMMSNDIFIQKMNEYLTDDRLDVILFASTECLNRAVKDESYRQCIDQAELFLPGEEALLSAHHVDVLQAGDMVVSCKSFGIMLENLTKQDRTMYIIAKSEAECHKLEEYCKRMQPSLRVLGSCIYDSKIEDAVVINEINTHTPDLLLLDLETGLQEEWLMEHSSLLNAKLCVAIGGVSGLILAEQRQTPGWVRSLHLEGIYRWIFAEQFFKRGVRARIFRKKVVQYNNQMEDSKKE